ncbi:MAG: DUF3467 domain-containing protein [Alistipes sp.]|nr:DUF3467 domain-containing protein [Candidatus Minthomonas equi]
MGQQNQQGGNQIDLSLSAEVAKGCYSNLALITHSDNEFIIDFARMLPGFPKPEICSRIIMTPENAKKLFLALRDNLDKFENQYGDIKLKTQQNPIPMGFGPSSAEA